MPVIDRATGESREAQIFVAVLGASNYTFAEAKWTQGLPDWIGAHVRALSFLGGASDAVTLLVPSTLLLMSASLAGFGWKRRKKC